MYRYGASKAAAETAVAAITPSAAIVRTSLILGDGDGQHEILTRDLIAGRAVALLHTRLRGVHEFLSAAGRDSPADGPEVAVS